jgi:hypothetical protein
MKRHGLTAVALVGAVGGLVYLPGASAATLDSARPFKAADLKVEINATDGDAGLQVFLDDDAWNDIKIVNPDGVVMVNLQATGSLEDYGLTELFSESSEPPFKEFPLEEFKKLFPEGDYVFTGTLVDGTKLRSEVPLTHEFPSGPTILRPRDGSEVSAGGLKIRWQPSAQTPSGVDIVGYQVIVVCEDDTRSLQADLGPSARKFRVPKEFLQDGTEYKAEVLAIETSGNQTLTEVSFTVK